MATGRWLSYAPSRLDAIHLASAMELREDLVALITYDARMTEEAKALLLPPATIGPPDDTR